MGATVVGKEVAGTITSSPSFKKSFSCFEQREEIATKFAEEPEFTTQLFKTPKYSENLVSKSIQSCPATLG